MRSGSPSPPAASGALHQQPPPPTAAASSFHCLPPEATWASCPPCAPRWPAWSSRSRAASARLGRTRTRRWRRRCQSRRHARACSTTAATSKARRWKPTRRTHSRSHSHSHQPVSPARCSSAWTLARQPWRRSSGAALRPQSERCTLVACIMSARRSCRLAVWLLQQRRLEAVAHHRHLAAQLRPLASASPRPRYRGRRQPHGPIAAPWPPM